LLTLSQPLLPGNPKQAWAISQHGKGLPKCEQMYKIPSLEEPGSELATNDAQRLLRCGQKYFETLGVPFSVVISSR